MESVYISSGHDDSVIFCGKFAFLGVVLLYVQAARVGQHVTCFLHFTSSRYIIATHFGNLRSSADVRRVFYKFA